MAFQKSFWFLMAFFIIFISFSHATTFQVGGKDGWTLKPSENYSNWSGRLRFLINDTLHFKYNGGSDSVLVVNKGGYDGCNLNSPIMKMDGGDSSFKFDRSGPFYFVSGNKSNCDQGQKLLVVVLALRNRSPPPTTTTPPPVAATPPSAAPSPSVLPPAPAVSPVFPPSPAAVSPGSPSPAAVSPGSPPPAAAVSPGSPVATPSGTPVLTPPAASPGGGSSTSPGGSGGATGQSPGSTNPADTDVPPPPSAAPVAISGARGASLATMIFALWLIN